MKPEETQQQAPADAGKKDEAQKPQDGQPAGTQAAAPPTPAPQGDQQKPPAPAPEPEDFEIATPKDVEISKEVIGNFKKLAKEQGLKGAQAQKMVDFYIDTYKADAQRAIAEQKSVLEGWDKEIKADPDFKDYPVSMKQVERAIDKFGDPAMKKEIANLPPRYVRFLRKVGAAMSEDQTTQPNGPSREARSEEQVLASRYPTMFAQPGQQQ